MGQALYRKYRSKNLSEIVGQEHITQTLDNALKKGTVSHAYLFTGPRGVGKTSIARILAHEINGLPYDETATHLDIIEIDAASNRRIDEIRTLRERVHNAPASAKYKVYIIDEVHMLTKEAFNALLKTLEEPPAHAIFVLATTEAHKLPETIVSRCIRFTFKPVEQSRAVKHLRYIANEEGIDISDEALALIAEHGGGSFRDSISLLDQLSNSGAVVDLAAAQKALGIAPEEAIARLASALQAADPAELLHILNELRDQGYQAPQVAKQLAKYLRTQLLNKEATLQPAVTSRLLQQLIDVPASHDPLALLEIILLEIALENVDTTAASPAEISTNAAPQPENEPTPSKKQESKKPQEQVSKEEISPASTAAKTELDETTWQNVLQTLKTKHNTLYGIARMATPLFKNGDLTLVFAFPFHQKRLSDSKNKQIIADIIAEQTGKNVTITCTVEPKAKNQPSSSEAQKPNLEAISNIFGSAEVLD